MDYSINEPVNMPSKTRGCLQSLITRITCMLAITYESEEYRHQAETLAARYHLELIPYYKCNAYDGLIVLITSDYIGLVKGPTRPFKNKPFYIDFFTGKLAHRSKQAGLRKEAIAR